MTTTVDDETTSFTDDSEKESINFVPIDFPLKKESEYVEPDVFTKEEYEQSLEEWALIYFLLLDFIPDPVERQKQYWLYGVAFGVSIFSSLYNKDFTKNFTKRSLETVNLPFSDKFNNNFAGVCGWASFLVNLFIGVQTLVNAYYKCTEELPEKYKNANTGHKSDRMVRAFIVLSIFASIIGVAPNMVFTYDTLSKKDSPLAFIVFNLFIQIIAVGTMNLRGVTNIVEIDVQRKKAAQNIRLDLLEALNNTLPPAQRISEKDLKLLSKGELYHRKHRKARHVIERIAAVLPIFYCMGFFAAAVSFFAPLLVGASLLIQGLLALNMLVGVVSFALKVVFLAYANISLVKMLLSQGDKPILDIPGLDDFRELPTALKVFNLVISVILGLLALGGPAAVIYNYLVTNIPVSYGGGFVAGFGVNVYDTYMLVSLITSTLYFRLKALFEGVPYEQKQMPWNTKEGFIQSRMRNVAQMKDAEVLKRFGEKVLDEGKTAKNAEPKEINEEKKPIKAGDRIYGDGIKYTENDAMRQCIKVCDSLKNSSPKSYSFFQKHYYEEGVAFEKVGVEREYVQGLVGAAAG